MRGASVAGSSPSFLGRERTAVDVDVCPERHSDHTALATMRPALLLREKGGFYSKYRDAT